MTCVALMSFTDLFDVIKALKLRYLVGSSDAIRTYTFTIVFNWNSFLVARIACNDMVTTAVMCAQNIG